MELLLGLTTLLCLGGSVLICQASTIPFLRKTNKAVRLDYVNWIWTLPLTGFSAIWRAGDNDRMVLVGAIAQCLLFIGFAAALVLYAAEVDGSR